MGKNINVTPDEVLENVSVIYVETLLTALGLSYSDYTESNKAVQAWCLRNGAHYYAEEKWVDDGFGNDTRGFSVWTGVFQAKRFGQRIVVCENLS